MKRIITFLTVALAVMVLITPIVWAMDRVETRHTELLYPVVRISHGLFGGSGTVIYSKLGREKAKFSTYILTNHHVIESAISIREEWDSGLKKEVQKEKRDVVYVEFFEYRALSIPVGTLKIEADVVLYDEDQDLALLKTRSDRIVDSVADLYPRNEQDGIRVFDRTVAVGCSLGFPPLPTEGIITRKGFVHNSYEFWFSSSQIIYGNSGGAMYLEETGDLIGIPSLLPIIGWGTPITHMGLFIPVWRIYDWLEDEHYTFIWDNSKTEAECLEAREKELEARRKSQ